MWSWRCGIRRKGVICFLLTAGRVQKSWASRKSLARLVLFSSMLFWPKFWKPVSLISLATTSADSSLKSVNPYIFIFKFQPVFLHVREPIGGLLTFVKAIYYFWDHGGALFWMKLSDSAMFLVFENISSAKMLKNIGIPPFRHSY